MLRGRHAHHRKPNAARWMAWLVLPTSLATATVLSAGPSFAAGTYRTTTSVNVRSAPGTGSPVIGSEPSGATFSLLCQWQGSTDIGGNSTWDDVTFANGVTGAITDYDTTTPSWNSYAPGTGSCGSNSSSSSGGSLGGVDMQQACKNQYPDRSGLQAIATNANSAYSWQCVGPGVSLGINVTAECQAQYGYGAVAAASNPASAWSWYCHWNITPQMQNAVSWAQSQIGQYKMSNGAYWSGYCEVFAEQAEGSRFKYGSAYLDYLAEANARRIHTGTTPPPGALVFYGPGTDGDGHVAVSMGNGQVIGTYGDANHIYPIKQYAVTAITNPPYLGWALPVGS